MYKSYFQRANECQQKSDTDQPTPRSCERERKREHKKSSTAKRQKKRRRKTYIATRTSDSIQKVQRIKRSHK